MALKNGRGGELSMLSPHFLDGSEFARKKQLSLWASGWTRVLQGKLFAASRSRDGF